MNLVSHPCVKTLRGPFQNRREIPGSRDLVNTAEQYLPELPSPLVGCYWNEVSLAIGKTVHESHKVALVVPVSIVIH